MNTITFKTSQIKWARLNVHYDTIETLLGDRFDTPFIAGVGNVNSKLVLIGEAPGATETRLGEPFVGPSGRMLNRGLRSIGLSRKRVFITNFLKYQPPENRDPQGDEVPVCLHLLRKELEILAPKIVVTLGVFSTRLFFEQPHMGTLAGQAWIKRGHVVIPMYHPASVMYGGFDKDTWYEHFQTIADCLAAPVPTATTPMNGTSVNKSLRHYR
jgi:uracil-DNA glycosylase